MNNQLSVVYEKGAEPVIDYPRNDEHPDGMARVYVCGFGVFHVAVYTKGVELYFTPSWEITKLGPCEYQAKGELK